MCVHVCACVHVHVCACACACVCVCVCVCKTSSEVSMQFREMPTGTRKEEKQDEGKKCSLNQMPNICSTLFCLSQINTRGRGRGRGLLAESDQANYKGALPSIKPHIVSLGLLRVPCSLLCLHLCGHWVSPLPLLFSLLQTNYEAICYPVAN